MLYIDYGQREKLSIHSLYPINKRFLNYPVQRIQFELADIKIKCRNTFKDAFDEIVNRNTFTFASVKRVDFNGLMSLYLYQREKCETSRKTNQLINLNKLIVSEGLAEIKYKE